MPKKYLKNFKLKNLGEYYDPYVQSVTLLPADVFKIFRNKCIETYEIDPAHFLSAPGLAWQACLIMVGVKFELLKNNMLMMLKKELEVEYVMQYIGIQKQIISI